MMASPTHLAYLDLVARADEAEREHPGPPGCPHEWKTYCHGHFKLGHLRAAQCRSCGVTREIHVDYRGRVAYVRWGQRESLYPRYGDTRWRTRKRSS